MAVSNFERIWRPQSPATPIGQSGVDRASQGDFFKIRNLTDKPYSFALSFVAAPAAAAERNLDGNTVVFIDTPGGNDALGTLNGTIGSTVFTPTTGNITTPAQPSALIALLPTAFNGPAGRSLTAQHTEHQGPRLRPYPPARSVQGHPVARRSALCPRRPVRQARSDHADSAAPRDALHQRRRTLAPYAVQYSHGRRRGSEHGATRPALRIPLPVRDGPQPAGTDRCACRQRRSQHEAGAALLSSLDGEKVNLAGMTMLLARTGIELALEKRKSRIGPSPVPAE